MSKKTDKTIERAREIFKAGAVIITAADIKDGVMEKVQLYFWETDTSGKGGIMREFGYEDSAIHGWKRTSNILETQKYIVIYRKR